MPYIPMRTRPSCHSVSSYSKSIHVHRAVEILKLLPLSQVCEEAENNDPGAESKPSSFYQQRMYLWSGIVKCAWSARLEQIVLVAAPYALQLQWTPENDHQMMILQVCYYLGAHSDFQLPSDKSVSSAEYLVIFCIGGHVECMFYHLIFSAIGFRTERLKGCLQIEVDLIRAESCVAALARKGEEFRPVQPNSTAEQNGMLQPPLSADELRCTALMVWYNCK